MPRDRSFTGNIVGGNGQGSLDILTGLAGSGVGRVPHRGRRARTGRPIGEMGGWAGITPNAKETYDWFVGKCATESAWLRTWKLADALATLTSPATPSPSRPAPTTRSAAPAATAARDNGWYTHWAGWVP